MSEVAGQKMTSNSSPPEALQRAAEALKLLEQGQIKDHQVSIAMRVAVYAVVVLAWTGLVVHTFFEDTHPQVDSTSVALLAVALIAPFVSRLKALEIGGAKAEWQEGATVSLKEIIQLLSMQQAAISQLFDEVTARAASGPEAQASTSHVDTLTEQRQASPRPLQRLLWVDDHPEHNTYELDSLRQIFEVVTVTDNEAAFSVLENHDIDAVISDVGRDVDEPGAPPGGVRLLRDFRRRYPDLQLPILFYTSSRSIHVHGRQLEESGALTVTSLFSDLLLVLRQIEEQSLEGIARSAASARGTLRRGKAPQNLDIVLDLPNGRTIGIEVASWLQRPQMGEFVERVSQLRRAIDADDISNGFLLARSEVLDDKRRAVAADQRIGLVAPLDLTVALDELARGS